MVTSSVQARFIAVLNSYERNDESMNTLEDLNAITNYVQMGGLLEDCAGLLGKLFSLTCFAGSSGEADQLLLAVLCSEEIHKKEVAALFDEQVIRQLLGTFQVRCCVRERSKFTLDRKNLWKSVLRETYANFYHHRPFIYDTIVEFFKYISTVAQPKSTFAPHVVMQEVDQKVLDGFYGVAELLEVVGAIIEGFDTPLKRQHGKELLQCALMPLHCNSLSESAVGCALAIYHRQLSFCITAFIHKEPSLLPHIIVRVCNFIPKMINGGYSKPAVYLVNEVEMLLEMLSLDKFDQVKQPFFSMLKLAVESLHFMIAQRSFLLLIKPSIFSLCELSNDYFEGNMIPLLLQVCQSHWNDSTKQMSFQVLFKWRQRPNNCLINNHKFTLIQETYTERWQSEAEAEKRKQRQMLMPKKNLQFNKFVFVKKMGEGSYSEVHHVRRIDSSVSQIYWEDYALKVMDEQQLMEQNYQENVTFEIHLLKNVFGKHPNIIKFIGEFGEHEKRYVVLEYAERGDLFNVIERLGTLDEEYSLFVMSQICNAIWAVHGKEILHLDLKPENILISKTGYMKLADFGAAVDMNKKDGHFQLQGTAEYLSPSLILGNRPTPADDVWTIGCMLYQLLAGIAPFNDSNEGELFRKIRERKLCFPPSFSASAKNLVSTILCIGQVDYIPITLNQVMKHEFFASVDWKNVSQIEAPLPSEGAIKAGDIDVNLRQRKNSMLLTQSLPRKYQFSSFSLVPIPESPSK